MVTKSTLWRGLGARLFLLACVLTVSGSVWGQLAGPLGFAFYNQGWYNTSNGKLVLKGHITINNPFYKLSGDLSIKCGDWKKVIDLPTLPKNPGDDQDWTKEISTDKYDKFKTETETKCYQIWFRWTGRLGSISGDDVIGRPYEDEDHQYFGIDNTDPTFKSMKLLKEGAYCIERNNKAYIKKGCTDAEVSYSFSDRPSGVNGYIVNGTTVAKEANHYPLAATSAGEKTFTVQAFDCANNKSSVQTYYYYVDDQAPAVTKTEFRGADATKMYKATSTGIQWYGQTTPSLYAEFSDNGGKGAGLKSATMGGINYNATTKTFENLLATEGKHDMYIATTDNVQNSNSQAAQISYTVDLTAPVLLGQTFLTDSENQKYMYYNANTKVTWFNKKDESARLKSGGANDGNGVGLWKLTYEVNGSKQDFPATEGGCVYLDRSKEGVNDCAFELIDSVQNVGSSGVKYGIDSTKPRILTNYKKHVLYADDYSEALSDTLSGLKSFQYSFDLVNWVEYKESNINDLLVVGNVYLRAIDNVDNYSDTLALYSVDAKNLVTVEGNKVVYALLNEAGAPYFNETMEAVDDNIFLDRTDITNVQFPESIKKIGEKAFKNCPNLRSVFCFTPTVPKLYSEAFADDDTKIYVLPELRDDFQNSSDWNTQFDLNSEILSNIPENNDEMWYVTANGKPIDLSELQPVFNNQIDEANSKYENSIGIIKFKGEVDRVARFAGQDNNNLRFIFLPKSVKILQPYAFQNCKNLEMIHTTENLEKINDCAFEGCDSLRLLYIQEGVKEINAFAFKNCKSLPEVTLPASIEYVGSRTFEGCDGIQSVTLLGTNPEKINMTHESFVGLQENTPIFVQSDKLLPFEAYYYGKGINFQTKVTKTIEYTRKGIFCHHNMIVPAGVQVYGAKWNGSKYVRTAAIGEGEILEGGKGYFIEDGLTSGIRNFVFVTTSEEATAGFDSELSGSIEKVSVGDLLKFGRVFVVITSGDDFYELDQLYTTYYLADYMAFGLVESQSGSPVKYFNFENWYNGWVTGVQTLSEPTANSEQPMFNLAGQAVGSDYKGIVIKNGKKYLNK